jgi:hypothetical protein
MVCFESAGSDDCSLTSANTEGILINPSAGVGPYMVIKDDSSSSAALFRSYINFTDDDGTVVGRIGDSSGAGQTFSVGSYLAGYDLNLYSGSSTARVTIDSTTGLVTLAGDLAVLGADGSDDDIIYFDSGTAEFLEWDDTPGEFDLSDDLNVTGNLYVGAESSVSTSAGIYYNRGTITDTTTFTAYAGSLDLRPSSDSSANYSGYDLSIVVLPSVNMTGVVTGVKSNFNQWGSLVAGKTVDDARQFETAFSTLDNGSSQGLTITNYSGLHIVDPDITNSAGTDITMTNAYGIYIEDFTPGEGTFTNGPWGIYQEGSDDLNYFGGSVDVEGQFSVGTQVTITDDTTPDVSASSSFLVDPTGAQTITDFDAGGGTLENGQIFFLEFADGNTTIDCDGGAINCGTTDITGAAGDIMTFFYDGADWHLISMMDDSVAQGGSGFDIAEWFPSSENLNPGDVVSVDPNGAGPAYVKKSTVASDEELLGIVSTNPGITLGEPSNASAYPVALAGRVPTKISTENGDISPGDALTSSSIPGVAMKAISSGPIVGKALEGYSGSGTGRIMVFVSTGWYVASPASENDQLADLTDVNVNTLAAGSITTDILFIGDRKLEMAADGTLVVDGSVNILGDVSIGGDLNAKSVKTDELVVSEETSGTNIIKVGQKEVTIDNTKVGKTSKILITFSTDYSPATRYWVSKKEGESFTVHLDQPTSADAEFSWLIIN